MTKKSIILVVIAIAIVVSILIYDIYFINPTSLSSHNTSIALYGAGATFPLPLYQKWSAIYKDLTGVKITYQGIGSGGGIKQVIEKTVDFGASDVPMTDSELSEAPKVVHIPMTIGGVVITYNIPGISEQLNFTGDVLADIFSLKITKWNDPKIQDLNPDVKLPDKEIIVVHRSDSSGTTKVFTSFLSDESPEWRDKYGAGKVINWPKQTIGGKGNPGVAAAIMQNSYSIGYVEFTYALKNNLPTARIMNTAGRFVAPSLETMASSASAMALQLPPGDASWESVGCYFNLHKVSDVKKIENAYPITSFSYIIVYKELSVRPGMTFEKARALIEFLWWAIHDGQKYAPELGYVPLPAEVVKHNEETLSMITFNGKPVKG